MCILFTLFFSCALISPHNNNIYILVPYLNSFVHYLHINNNHICKWTNKSINLLNNHIAPFLGGLSLCSITKLFVSISYPVRYELKKMKPKHTGNIKIPTNMFFRIALHIALFHPKGVQGYALTII